MKDYKNEYPLNTFSGETKKELLELIDKVRKETAEDEEQRILNIVEKIQEEEEKNRFGTNLDWDDGFITAINEILKKIIIIK